MEQNAIWKIAIIGQAVHSSALAATNKLKVQMAYIIQNYNKVFSKS